MTMNKLHVIHTVICFIYLKILVSGILVSGMSTVWEYIYGCAKKYRCDFYIYLMTVLSYSYFIIMDFAINTPGRGGGVVDGLNAT